MDLGTWRIYVWKLAGIAASLFMLIRQLHLCDKSACQILLTFLKDYKELNRNITIVLEEHL